ncbi:MAG: 2-iminoacetate synthase ThiH [Muribaculaceae bacterium]|nr:2-iminoacetate synthase ThiH [Muribaculaceae bacterium]
MTDSNGHAGFSEVLARIDWNTVTERIAAVTDADVTRVLAKARLNRKHLDADDFIVLVSEAAEAHLEEMACLSRQFTLERFGRTISMYIPMYVSNACTNKCVYCGFNHDNPMTRTILTMDQVKAECEAIKRLGPFENLLIVSGEFPSLCGIDYFSKVLETCRPYFHNLTIEVQPLKQAQYETLVETGLHGVVCFQETYHRPSYKECHPRGMKSIFEWRLDGYDRMGRAGLHKIGMGVLLGLQPEWRTDAAILAFHLRYLQKKYWRTRYSINFPRMCPSESGFQPRALVTDRQLAQLTFAFRIFDHDVDISYSTRESDDFRRHMMPLGVTSMSAGSCTEPGGYASVPDSLEQFSITDSRSPEAVASDIRADGYEPVWKDWDSIFD